jgi:phosphoribosylformylglycinamidine (FGAM) synthase PurS component
MKADGYVTPQRAVLDPQGQAIHGVLKRMQYSGFEDVPQGKYFQPLYPRPDHQNQSLSLFRAFKLFVMQ